MLRNTIVSLLFIPLMVFADTPPPKVLIGNFGSSPTAKGATISGQATIVLQPADATHPGSLKGAGSQTIEGPFTATSGFVGALTGNASTASALAANPSDCSAGEFATAIAASGNLTCTTPTGTGASVHLDNLSGVLINAHLRWDAHDTYELGQSLVNAQNVWSLRLQSSEGLLLQAEDDINMYAGTGDNIRMNSDVRAGNINAVRLDADSDLAIQATHDINVQAGTIDTINLNSNTVVDGDITADNFLGNSTTATALAANPTDCGSDTYATTIGANGNLTCASITNASTTGTASNTPSTLVLRDGSGNFSAGTISAALTGNSSTSTALASNPTDCGSDTYATTIAANGNLTCAAITNASTSATAANTNSTIVLRDGSGNFAAGTITAALTGNASTATALAANPSACTGGQFVTDIDANGTLTCGAASSTPAINSSDMENCSIDGTVSGNILTVSILQANGSTPSTGTASCLIGFRDTTATVGTYTQVAVTAATTTTVSSTSSLGCTASTTCEVFIYAINNAGTVEAGVTGVNLLDEGSVQTSTAEGGAGASDTANTLYSTTARTSKAIRVMGRLKITPNGTFQWNANPTFKQNAPFPPSLSNLANASDSHTVDLGTTRQFWKWSTLDTGSALKLQPGNNLTSASLLELDQTINGGGVNNTTMLITGTGSGSTCTSLKINNSCGSGGVTGSMGQQINMSGNNISPGLELNQSSGNASARGMIINITGTLGAVYGLVVNNSKTDDGAIGIYSNMSPTTGAHTAVLGNAASSNAGAIGGNFGVSHASATGYGLKAYNSGTGGAALLATGTATGVRNVVEIQNIVAAANNSGAAITFRNNRTTGGMTTVAQVAGVITDITSGAYTGDLVAYSANNAAPSEHWRMKETGHIIYTGTAPTLTANCGTTPAIAGNDIVGRITIGTGGTDVACTLTFNKAWATAPVCVVATETTALLVTAASTTTTLIITSATPFTAADKLVYQCSGY